MHEEFLVSSAFCPEARFSNLAIYLSWELFASEEACPGVREGVSLQVLQAVCLIGSPSPTAGQINTCWADLNYPPSSLCLGLNGVEQAVCFVYTLRT